MQRTHRLWIVIIIAMMVAILAPTPGGARPSGEPRDGAFTCRASATKLGDEITVTFTLRTGTAGRRWQIRIWDNDVRLLSRERVTNEAGNITVRAGAENLPHQDVFRFRATHASRGSVCRVTDLRV
ncbi:MAG TPA: hypothetical protein VI341_05260 [Actinomycetota bacterium]